MWYRSANRLAYAHGRHHPSATPLFPSKPEETPTLTRAALQAAIAN